MAKELPYFKFEPNQWENGNIQICSREDKGLFIDLCSMYWSRLGDLPFKLAVQKLCVGNANAFNSLIEEGIFEVIDDHICIEFLNEQLKFFEDKSEANRKIALEGWKKRRKQRDESERNANASDSQSERNAIREEEIREKKKKEEESKNQKKEFLEINISNENLKKAFTEFLEHRKDKGARVKSQLQMDKLIKRLKKLSDEKPNKAIEIIDQSIAQGWTGLFSITEDKKNGKPSLPQTVSFNKSKLI